MLPCAVWDQIPPLWPVDFAGKLDSNGIGCVEAAGGEKGTMLFSLRVMASAWSWLTFSQEVEAISRALRIRFLLGTVSDTLPSTGPGVDSSPYIP